jgi:ligand-binding SRPBCC domain-containing protein
MKIFTLKREQHLNISLDEAWKFFSDPRNLALITPPWLNFMIDSDVPDKIYPGLIIAYRVKPLLGIPVNWITEITHAEAPNYFVDEQRSGPYKFWHHQHHFKANGAGTQIEDIVNYAPPVAGSLLNSLIISRKLNDIFDFRKKYLQEKFYGQN